MKRVSTELDVDFLTARTEGVAAFRGFYERRIDRADQVDVEAILQWQRRLDFSAHSLADFSAKASQPDPRPCHMLFGVWERAELVGFGNLIYLPSVRAVFSPYLAVDRASGDPSSVTRALFDILNDLDRAGPNGMKRLIFEFSVRDPRAAKARRRIFSRHLEAIGWTLGEVGITYRCPNVDGASGKAIDAEAQLMFAHKRDGGVEAPDGEALSTAELIRTIYFDVYAAGLAAGPGGEAYRAQLEAELGRLKTELPEKLPMRRSG